ncbi:MAG: hypothetical protein RL186_1757 [Pseudomonadota bacterium]|jgi:hypothetical protein
MKIELRHIAGFVGLVGFALALYWAKSEAQVARERVVSLQRDVDTTRRDVRTLEAEVAWLERPDRLEATARQTLGLAPIAAQNTLGLADLNAVAPLPTAPKVVAPSTAPKSTAVPPGREARIP